MYEARLQAALPHNAKTWAPKTPFDGPAVIDFLGALCILCRPVSKFPMALSLARLVMAQLGNLLHDHWDKLIVPDPQEIAFFDLQNKNSINYLLLLFTFRVRNLANT